MYERIQLMLNKVLTVRVADLKREEGQGATEYAMVIGFLIVTLTLGSGALGTGINGFLQDVAGALPVVP
jgi:Flp pilus assembly pilin Flp